MDAVAILMDFILKKNFRLEKQSKKSRVSICPQPPQFFTAPTKGHICDNPWTFMNSLLSPKVRNWNQTSLLVLHILWIWTHVDFPGGASGKESTCQCRRLQRLRFDPWVRKTPWRREWQPPPIFLPGESHEQRSLAGNSPWGHKESYTTEAT